MKGERKVHYKYEDLRDKAKSTKQGFQESGKVEYSLLLESLDELNQVYKEDDLVERSFFIQYFQDAIVGAYYRYVETKKKAWSTKKRIFVAVCSALVPVLFAVCTKWVAGEGINSLVVGSLVSIFWLVGHVYLDLNKSREDKETWVRHSICFARLHQALSVFLASKRTEDDYQQLVANTFSILEQNLDQFALNLFKRGIASRPDKGK